jgi:methionyl aminopeptidase
MAETPVAESIEIAPDFLRFRRRDKKNCERMAIAEQYIESGRITREVRNWVKETVRPGMGYVELCRAIEAQIESKGGKPAFPTGVGVNAVTAHYAPQEDDRSVFREGDLAKIDFGTHVDGYVTDTAVTVTFNPDFEILLEAAERALQAAVEAAKKETRVGEIGRVVHREAARFGFKTIENLTGHTVDRYVVHAGKSIPNLYMPHLPSLKNGDVFALEPFLTLPSAAGYVIDGPQRTIFSIVARRRTGDRAMDTFLERVWNDRRTLPFTPRWYAPEFGAEDLQETLKGLMAKKLVRGYSTLVEASGKPVAQFEHTVALDGALTVLT